MNLAYSSNAYRRWPVEAAIDRIAAIGYRGIELMADTPHLWPPDTSDARADETRRRIADRGLTVSNINAFMMCAVESFVRPSWIEPDAGYRQKRIDHTIASLRLAKRFGARCITTEPGGPLEAGQSREAALDLFVRGLNDALRVAEHLEVMLLVEPEPGLLIESADQFLELAERVSSPMFGLNFDIGHFFCVNENLSRAVHRLKHLTRHYHIEDIPASRVHEHLIPGHGAIDFPAVLRAIQETGYTAASSNWVTVELYPYLEDPDAAGREAMAFLESRLSGLGSAMGGAKSEA